MNYIYTLKDYRCDKQCPYCITKIIGRQDREDIKLLPEYLSSLEGNYDDFILSGNGEPSLYSLDTLSFIKEAAESCGKFKKFRVQTSGLLFNQEKKLDLFFEWEKEITVMSYHQTEDQDFYKYRKPYLHKTWDRPDVRCNYVLLLNKFDNKTYLHEISALLTRYNTLALKLLDTNDEWVTTYGVPYSKKDEILADLDKILGVPYYDQIRGRFVWTIEEKVVTMSYGKKKSHDLIQIER